MSENGEPEVEEQPQPENGWININNEYLLPRSFLKIAWWISKGLVQLWLSGQLKTKVI